MAWSSDAPASEPDGLRLSFDSGQLTQALVERLGSTFSSVSTLPPASGTDVTALVAESNRVGADLILEARLSHGPRVSSSLNDQVWLSLVLHAVGGPFSWLISDRTYTFQVQLEVQLFDATSAAAVATAAWSRHHDPCHA